jgi:hypothetical protein
MYRRVAPVAPVRQKQPGTTGLVAGAEQDLSIALLNRRFMIQRTILFPFHLRRPHHPDPWMDCRRLAGPFDEEYSELVRRNVGNRLNRV